MQYQAFPQVLPKHPHRTLYILLTVLLFVLVAGGIVYYQINQTNPSVQSPPAVVHDNSNIELAGLALLQNKINKSVTQKEVVDGLKILNAKHAQLIKNKK